MQRRKHVSYRMHKIHKARKSGDSGEIHPLLILRSEDLFFSSWSLIEKTVYKVMNNILNNILIINVVLSDCFILCATKVQFGKEDPRERRQYDKMEVVCS